MKAYKNVTAYWHLRKHPFWRLLAAANGPTIIGLLQTHLYDHDRRLPSSIFHERIDQDLKNLRAKGEDFPQTAQAYISTWLNEGYLERRFPDNATEEEYELSTSTIEVIRLLTSIENPHLAATESRLALVIEALTKLADDSDTNKFRRIDRLHQEQTRIEKEIEAIHKGQMRVIPHTTAIERLKEIISLADGLTNDFLHVRDQFKSLSQKLKEELVKANESRSVVLDSLFAGIDLIANSEAGKTFSAFWHLLTNPEQRAILENAINEVLSRDFIDQLNDNERKFLGKLIRTLLEQSSMVRKIMKTFAYSLKSFVQSREYLEQQRIHQLLKESQRTALEVKNKIKLTELVYTLNLTSTHVCSLSQWKLYDPALEAIPEKMSTAKPLELDLSVIRKLVLESEIDFEGLKKDILAILQFKDQASTAEVLEKYPAKQGLGSIVGLLVLGHRHGIKTLQTEHVFWTASDTHHRSAWIPKIFFSHAKKDELEA